MADAFKYAGTKLGPKVRHGFHALSLDERRKDFSPLPLGTEKQCRSRFRGESPFIEFVVPGYALSFEEDEREVLGP